MYALFYLFSLALAGALGVFWGGLIPAKDFADKKLPDTKPYRLGFAIGGTILFVGAGIVEIMLLEPMIGLIGHGFVQLMVPGLIVGAAFTVVGLGISYRNRLAVLCLLPMGAGILYLYIDGLDHGVAGASTDDIIGFIILTGVLAYIAAYMGQRWREFGAIPGKPSE